MFRPYCRVVCILSIIDKFIYRKEEISRKLLSGQRVFVEDLKSEAAALSVETVTRLEEATELSDAAMIDQVIEDIRIENGPLADALFDLAESFAYDKILALLQIAKTSKGPGNDHC